MRPRLFGFRHTMAFIALTTSLSALLFMVTPLPAQSSASSEMLLWINTERAEAGLPALSVDARLESVAHEHAEHMATYGYLSHISPDTGTPSNRVLQAGIEFRIMGENVGSHYSLRAIHEALMQSASHRGNILHPEYREVGIGIARRSDGTYIVVEVFTKQANAYTDDLASVNGHSLVHTIH